MGDREALIRFGLVSFGVIQLAIAALQVFAPGTFFEEIGPFGERNDHYIADGAAFVAGPAIAALLAVRRPSWHLPVLVVITAQTGLHALNHLVDIGEADPEWIGVADFVALFLGTVLLAGLVRFANQRERA